MKRVVIASLTVVAVALVIGLAVDGLPDRKANNSQYYAMVDNAFGLIEGGDLKIAGVRAGKITELDLDPKSLQAKVGFRITKEGFGDLRSDITCETRPQSLIGEYFLDCDPGTGQKRLKQGAVIPVERTATTIAPDLVNNILRRPQAERLSLIISSLGAGVAGNAQNLNDAIRRGAPALRETDRVLHILANQNTTIRDLNANADRILASLARERGNVGRWVLKARDISRDSAERRDDIARGFHDLPVFLQELRPTMQKLGATADAQEPALRLLDQNAPQLKRLFGNLVPFSEASRPAFRSLGQAAQVGSDASKKALPTIQQLNTFAKDTPELGRNLALILEHLDDRKNAIQYDKRAAQQQGVSGPSGYSGLEALLQYVLDQATSTNIYDQSTHILAVQAFEGGECTQYRDAALSARGPEHADLKKQCQVRIGPNAPGVDTPDATANDAPKRCVTGPEAPANDPDGDCATQAAVRWIKRDRAKDDAADAPAASGTADAPATESGDQAQKTESKADEATGVLGLPPLKDVLPQDTPPVPQAPAVQDTTERTQGKLLDYLMGG